MSKIADPCPNCGSACVLLAASCDWKRYECDSYTDAVFHQSKKCMVAEIANLQSSNAELEKRNEHLEDENNRLSNENAEMREARSRRLV